MYKSCQLSVVSCQVKLLVTCNGKLTTQRPLDAAGQTIIALLIFMMLAITITTAAVAVTLGNSQANTSYALGEVARANAEAGVENGLEVLLRNPSYTATNASVTVPSGTATITVSGTTTKTIVAVGNYGSMQRTITATAAVANNAYTLSSWAETP